MSVEETLNPHSGVLSEFRESSSYLTFPKNVHPAQSSSRFVEALWVQRCELQEVIGEDALADRAEIK